MSTRINWLPIAVVGLFLAASAATSPLQSVRTSDLPDLRLEEALHVELVEGDLERAIAIYDEIVEQHGDHREIAARALLHKAICLEKLGRAGASSLFERVVREYEDVPEMASAARGRLAASGGPLTAMAGSGIVLTRVLDDMMADGVGMPSPDGRLISVIDWNTGNLGVLETATGDSRMLTDRFYPEFALFSVFSRDSARIAYTWYTATTVELRVIDVAGGEPRTLVTGDITDTYVQPEDFAPSGDWILATSARPGPSNRIVKVDANTGETTVLRSFDWRGTFQMSLSPDGDVVAYDFPTDDSKPGVRDLYLLAEDGSFEHPLVVSPANDWGPVWTRDGRWILFMSDRAGSPEIWAQQVRDGLPLGEPVRVHSGAGFPMGITDDGALFFHRNLDAVDIFSVEWNPGEASVVGEPRRVLRQSAAPRRSPSWSPGGRRVAYRTELRPSATPYFNQKLVIADPTTGQERQYDLLELRMHGAYQWGPDGDRVLLQGQDGRGIRGLYWLDLDSERLTTIVRGTPDVWAHNPYVDSSGRILYYRRTAHGDERLAEIVRRDLETGDESVVLEQSARRGDQNPIENFRLAPDGRRIGILRSSGASNLDERRRLTLLELDSGRERVVHEPPAGRQIGAWTFTPDSRALLVVTLQAPAATGLPSPTPPSEVWHVPLDGSTPTPTGLRSEDLRISALSFHPDGGRLAYLAGRGAGEVWMLQGLMAELEGLR